MIRKTCVSIVWLLYFTHLDIQVITKPVRLAVRDAVQGHTVEKDGLIVNHAPLDPTVNMRGAAAEFVAWVITVQAEQTSFPVSQAPIVGVVTLLV